MTQFYKQNWNKNKENQINILQKGNMRDLLSLHNTDFSLIFMFAENKIKVH